MDYNPQKIEKKWQRVWGKEKLFKARDISKKPKFYCLDMFPYPSAEGVHVGHLRGYTFSDVIAKKKIMEGRNVLHPMGWDAFGLPAENFSIKTGIHPAISTKRAIKNIKKQLISAGFGYDWQREICACNPDYYKWTQWMFLQFYKAGLAYRKEAAVNFCPSCKTVLANEQVVDGKCERCDTLVGKKYLEQWFFKITEYAERLLSDLNKIDWPEKIKIMQENWIGRSVGTEIDFQVYIGDTYVNFPVFTTRIDTLFGCTYLVIAPEYSLIEKLKFKIENWAEVKKYIEEAKKKTEIERLAEDKEKTGIEIRGIKAINPVNNQEVPIFVADYVLMEYGTGAIMAVPAHDQRDFLFAKKYNLPIVEVIKSLKTNQAVDESKDSSPPFANARVFEEEGVLTNSGIFSGIKSAEAREEMTKYLEKRNLAKKAVYYKLRDWLISRQRYWGAPIPIIYCPKCGKIPVPEKDLPVLLPKIKDFKPTGKGESPLAKSIKFVNTKCPKCRGPAKRETDTMDTFVCSSWYFLRYVDPKNPKTFASKEKIKIWLPVDLYIGGAEHAVMHLLYARFFAKALFDQKLIEFAETSSHLTPRSASPRSAFDEPFSKLFNQGTVYRQGAKMSKSRGNVVTPDYIIKKFGADTMRLYELFMGPAAEATEWSDKGIIGCYRFLQKVWNLQKKIENCKLKLVNFEKLLHKTIKKVTEDIENFRFNTAVSALMILTNEFEKFPKLPTANYQLLLKLLAPMAPHIAEELWQNLGLTSAKAAVGKHKKSIFLEKWPEYNPKLVKEEIVTLVIQVNGRVRDKIEVKASLSEEKARALAISREKVQKWIEGKEIKKVVFVQGKLINIVI